MDTDSPREPNITISRAALRVELLETEIRLKDYFDTRLANKAESAQVADLERRFESMATDIRTLQEERRLAEERLKVAADVLATETERRREALVDATGNEDRRFTRRERIFASAVSLLLLLATVYLAIH